MINKLKRKFIILATVSILLLMTVLVGVMNLINYSVVVKESDAVLDVLALPDNPTIRRSPTISAVTTKAQAVNSFRTECRPRCRMNRAFSP